MKFTIGLSTVLTFLFITPSIAADFCSLNEMAKNSKSKTPVKEFEAEVSKLGNVLYSSNKEHCEFIKNNKDKDNYIVIDARGRGTRGSIKGAVKIVSDHDDLENHQFTPEMFSKSLEKFTAKYTSKEKDSKQANLIIFCNGPKCYRTSWAACSLKKMGYDKSKLHLVLDGYFGLKKNCL